MDVDALFQRNSVAAAREVAAQTRHAIEEKKQQLRRVVGDSYRDLISSADTIIDISRSCHRLVELTGAVQRGLSDMAGGITARGAGGSAEPAASSYDRLYALGSRIKYLVDTPETIYGCLDSREFLAAARRYVRAAEVHRLLTAGQAKHVAQRFPLLQHQWPLVKKFRSQVYTASGAWLASHGELTAPQAAATLAAQALLKHMDGAEVLKAFLTARQAYIMQCLSAATSAQADTDLDSLAFVLADVATMVCATLAQCGELFLQLPGVSATPLLAQALSESDSSADLLFDSGKEADAWKAHVEATRARLTELSSAGLALECSGWLDQLSQQLRQLSGRLLGPCGSGQGLLHVESAVRAALDGWRCLLQPSGAGADGQDIESPHGATMSWGDICQWVLGRPSPLWPLLFEQPLLERAKQLVLRDFTTVVDEVAGLLGSALQEASSLPQSAPGAFQASSWHDAVDLQPALPEAVAAGSASSFKRRRLAKLGVQGAGQANSAQGQPSLRWLAQCEHVVERFDQQLSNALVAALDACGSSLAQRGVDGTEPQKESALVETAASRALVLEPFVQDRCVESVEAIAGLLAARLLALPQADAAAAGASAAAAAAYVPTAIQALILGRTALGLTSRSSMLPVVLGQPAHWHAALGGRASGGHAFGAHALQRPGSRFSASGPAAAAAGPRYERLHQRLRDVGLQAYGLWAGWAATCLAADLIAGLAADHTLSADVPLRCWEETVISDGNADELALEGDRAGASLEMRFQLPAAPSPAAVQLAMAACLEADRAGGHLLEEEPLQLFKWHLSGNVLAQMGAALAEPGGGVSNGSSTGALFGTLSEKGVLQLLLDVRFLQDLLASSAFNGAGAPDAASSVARRRDIANLEAQLSSQLDPIDWATYEPYLYANEGRAARRRQVLFGILLRGTRLLSQQAGAQDVGASMAADSNTLRMAAVGPRFSYLPVTTPVALLRQASLHQLQSAGSLSHTVLTAADSSGITDWMATGRNASAADYSFAALLSSKTRLASQEVEEPGGNAVPMATGVSAAANKFVGSLQGLLGDKAAEVSSWSDSVFARGFK
ncbi:hypothetical protein D9Q98_010466 [Chlorella vulgaris]|uniref:Conserved oligomeric Golgi complex subunit 1 n=1 Tax=Chlorella vulgaris TaxID=3077 RepID=A0A9D4TRZ7_CHLVU|nr:hypothetical protein D9Q98_010466 [Chlorella vulgaris]